MFFNNLIYSNKYQVLNKCSAVSNLDQNNRHPQTILLL